MNFQLLFALGMKRQLNALLNPIGLNYDIGASGKYHVEAAIALGAPEWEWPRDQITDQEESVAQVHAYHFLEHLTGRDAISFMREVERVLIPGGVFNYCVPYYNTTLAAQNLDHLSLWCEDTFNELFNSRTYRSETWRLSVNFQVIAGVVQRNLVLVGQIVKDRPHLDAFANRNEWFYP